MLLLHQTTNHHLDLATPTPKLIIYKGDSYSDTSDKSSFSFDDVNVSALNEREI
jgi:hypothetical protein